MTNETPALNWWMGLDPEWKKAYGMAFFHHFNEPSPPELAQLYSTPVLRLVGPCAPYPNMDFELTGLSGVKELYQLELLVVTHHRIRDVSALQSLQKLKGLFLFNNRIENLDGIEALAGLEQLYVQFNDISSLKPIRQLTRLKELYINNNAFTSLDGLTEDHSDRLNAFFCKPNNGLRQKEMLYVENQLGIRCRGI